MRKLSYLISTVLFFGSLSTYAAEANMKFCVSVPGNSDPTYHLTQETLKGKEIPRSVNIDLVSNKKDPGFACTGLLQFMDTKDTFSSGGFNWGTSNSNFKLTNMRNGIGSDNRNFMMQISSYNMKLETSTPLKLTVCSYTGDIDKDVDLQTFQYLLTNPNTTAKEIMNYMAHPSDKKISCKVLEPDDSKVASIGPIHIENGTKFLFLLEPKSK
jgi:hypothetical protein